MADVTKHLPIGGNNLTSDLKGLFGVLRTRRTMIFAYGFMFAFVACTVLIAFNPSGNNSPWFSRFFSGSQSSASSTAYRSQFPSIFSYIFPDSPSSATGNTAGSFNTSGSNRPTSQPPVKKEVPVRNRTENAIFSDSNRDSNFTASLLKRNGTVDSQKNRSSEVLDKPRNQTGAAPERQKNGTPGVSENQRNQTTAVLEKPRNQTQAVPEKEKNGTTLISEIQKNGTLVGWESQKNHTKTDSGKQKEKNKKVRDNREKEKHLVDSLKHCEIFHGKWVEDDSYPLYKEGSCPHIDEPFNCYLNGRPDRKYQKLRWQPHGCNIPRLNARDMLERLRGKRLVFVGDSLNRNMWESLVCVLRNSVKDKRKVFEASGKSQFRADGSYSFIFEDYNCSVEFFRSPFLVQEWETPEPNGTTKETLRLDIIESHSSKYRNADIVVFNTGHWWTHEKTSKGKDYYQEGSHIYGQLNVVEAFRKALTTWARWVDKNINSEKTLVFFRGYSSSHFSGGRWNSGGQCDSETEPIKNETYLAPYPPKMNVLESVLHGMKTPISYLNITRMTDYRKDAHPSIYRKQNLTDEERRSPLRYQDCSHWCLPGVPDTWNELLYAQLLIKLHKRRSNP